MNIKVQRVKVAEFTNFIKKLLPIDNFVYLKLQDGKITSNCYLPERDAVKLQSIDMNEIFEIENMIQGQLKMSFLNGSHTIDALSHFTGEQVSAEIEYRELAGEAVVSSFKLISDALTVTLPCADPSLGFQDMSEDQIKSVFSTNDNLFQFDVQPFHIDKLTSLFKLEKEEETFTISNGPTGIKFKGKTYDSLVAESNSSEDTELLFYKRYINLLDKESYRVTILSHKAVWESLDSDTMLTIATCSGV